MTETIKKEKYYTLEDYEKFVPPNNEKCELIDGQIVMQTRPTAYHQIILSNLIYQFTALLKGKNCKPIGEVEIKINDDILVPDLMVMCSAEKGYVQRFDTPPTLVVEILSPSNTFTEIFQKIYKYKSFGIKEVWVVLPPEQKIFIFTGDDKNIKVVSSGKIFAESLGGIALESEEIFSDFD